MIAAWASKAITPLIVLAVLIATALFLGWLTLATVNGMVRDAREEKALERDAFWTAKIEKANALTATKQATQILEVLLLEKETTDKVAALDAQQANLEKRNAALPNGGACGLGHDRVRLLPRQ